MPWQPGHQQRWRASRRSTGDISSQDARDRQSASGHHAKVGDLFLHGRLKAEPARVLPQDDERSRSPSLDSHPMYGGADATGQSAIANDATAPAHRRRNPGESLRGGPTLPEPAVSPVAVGHERDPIRQRAHGDKGISSTAAAGFVTGLLADLEIKTSWQPAEHAGHDRPDAMQRLLYRVKWDADDVRDDVRQVVIDRLGDPDGILVVDETGDLKRVSIASVSNADTSAPPAGSKTPKSAYSSPAPAGTDTP
jgi:DDE superfamily endonuclease